MATFYITEQIYITHETLHHRSGYISTLQLVSCHRRLRGGGYPACIQHHPQPPTQRASQLWPVPSGGVSWRENSFCHEFCSQPSGVFRSGGLFSRLHNSLFTGRMTYRATGTTRIRTSTQHWAGLHVPIPIPTHIHIHVLVHGCLQGCLTRA